MVLFFSRHILIETCLTRWLELHRICLKIETSNGSLTIVYSCTQRRAQAGSTPRSGQRRSHCDDGITTHRRGSSVALIEEPTFQPHRWRRRAGWHRGCRVRRGILRPSGS